MKRKASIPDRVPESLDSRPSEAPVGRWMALDVGLRRIGVAVADPLGIAVRPLLALARGDTPETVEEIARLIEREGVDRLVVGRPRHMDGRESEIWAHIEPLARQAASRSGVELHWADERLSSKEAEAVMAERKVPVAERRALRDQYAAALILRWFLDDLGLEGASNRTLESGGL